MGWLKWSESIWFWIWIRYVARYPITQYSRIARHSRNLDFGDARIGDRTLVFWLGDGLYHFTTYDGGNLNFH